MDDCTIVSVEFGIWVINGLKFEYHKMAMRRGMKEKVKVFFEMRRSGVIAVR